MEETGRRTYTPQGHQGIGRAAAPLIVRHHGDRGQRHQATAAAAAAAAGVAKRAHNVEGCGAHRPAGHGAPLRKNWGACGKSSLGENAVFHPRLLQCCVSITWRKAELLLVLSRVQGSPGNVLLLSRPPQAEDVHYLELFDVAGSSFTLLVNVHGCTIPAVKTAAGLRRPQRRAGDSHGSDRSGRQEVILVDPQPTCG